MEKHIKKFESWRDVPENEFLIDKSKTIIDQLKNYHQGMDIIYLAVLYLKDSDDIEKFFKEWVEEAKMKYPFIKNPENKFQEILRSYSIESRLRDSCRNFEDVLLLEFEKAYQKNKKI